MQIFQQQPKKTLHYEAWVESLPRMNGKTVVISGTTNGIGYYLAEAAIRCEAILLLMLDRDWERARKVAEKLDKLRRKLGGHITIIKTIPLDYADFDNVRAAAVDILIETESLGGLDVLINNGGIMGFPDIRTVDKHDVQMQVNHLGHALLCKQILPALLKAVESGRSPRIVEQSAGARNWDGSTLDPSYFELSEGGTLGGNGILACYQRFHMSKLANACFTMAMQSEFDKRGIPVKCVGADPGMAETNLLAVQAESHANTSAPLKLGASVVQFFAKHIRATQSAADGSLPAIHAAFSEDIEGGDFICPVNKSHGQPVKLVSRGVMVNDINGRKPAYEVGMLNLANQEMAWRKTEEFIGPFFPSNM